MYNDSGPCKLKRVDSPAGVFVTIERDPTNTLLGHVHGEGVIELAATQIACTPQWCLDTRSGEHSFTVFSLESDDRGTWQLRIGLAPPAGISPIEIIEQQQADLVLGALPHEDGRAGLVPRLDKHRTPTPGSQLFLRPLRLAAPQSPHKEFTIENSIGALSFYGGMYWFGRTDVTASVFQLHKILDMYNPNMSVHVLEFMKTGEGNNNNMLNVMLSPEQSAVRTIDDAIPENTSIDTSSQTTEHQPPRKPHQPQIPLRKSGKGHNAADAMAMVALIGAVGALAWCGGTAVAKQTRHSEKQRKKRV